MLSLKESMSALISLWYNKNYQGEGGSQSFIIPLQRAGRFEKRYHETTVVGASQNTPGCWDMVLWRSILSREALFSSQWFLRATHPVSAVLAQVIASDEEGHKLPVILKIHTLVPWNERQNNHNKERPLWNIIIWLSRKGIRSCL